MTKKIENQSYGGFNKIYDFYQLQKSLTHLRMDGGENSENNAFCRPTRVLTSENDTQNETEGITTRAMEFAAQNGHMDVVIWVHENRSGVANGGAAIQA